MNGPQQYDIWHLGATAEAVAMDPAVKCPLPPGIILNDTTTIDQLITNQHRHPELQVLIPLDGNLTSETNVLTSSSTITPQEVFPGIPLPLSAQTGAMERV